MKCPICNFGEMKDGKTIVTLQREEAVIVIKNVPARVCENCGEYMLSEAVTARVMELAEQAIAHHAEIEVLQYAA